MKLIAFSRTLVELDNVTMDIFSGRSSTSSKGYWILEYQRPNELKGGSKTC